MITRAKETLVFLRASLTRYREIGMPLPSSELVARGLTSMLPLDQMGLVVEVGAGTGALTRAILRNLRNDARLFCVEKNPEFCELLRRSFQNQPATILACALEDVFEHNQQLQLGSADCVILSLPARLVSDETRERWSTVCDRLLKPGGWLVVQQCVPVMTEYFTRWKWRMDASRWLLGVPPFKVQIFRKPAPALASRESFAGAASSV